MPTLKPKPYEPTTRSDYTPTRYYQPRRFRCLTDDQVGQIQHLVIDLGEKAKDVARQFGVSIGTVYTAKACVPEDLLTFDDVGIRRWRHKFNPKKRRRHIARTG